MKVVFRAAKFVGQFAMLAAAMAFLVTVTLFLTGSFLLTWPLHRKSPRNRKLRASMDIARSVMVIVMAIQQQEDDERLSDE